MVLFQHFVLDCNGKMTKVYLLNFLIILALEKSCKNKMASFLIPFTKNYTLLTYVVLFFTKPFI